MGICGKIGDPLPIQYGTCGGMGEKSTHIRVKFKNLTLIYVVSSKLTLMYVVSSKQTLKWGSYIHSGHFMKWP